MNKRVAVYQGAAQQCLHPNYGSGACAAIISAFHDVDPLGPLTEAQWENGQAKKMLADFRSLFKPEYSEDEDMAAFWWSRSDPLVAEYRANALCLMAAMVEAGDIGEATEESERGR